MKCDVCQRPFQDGDAVIPVLSYVVNDKRGDFVGNVPSAYIHAAHATSPTGSPSLSAVRRG